MPPICTLTTRDYLDTWDSNKQSLADHCEIHKNAMFQKYSLQNPNQ